MNRFLSWIEPENLAESLKKAEPPRPPAPGPADAPSLSFWRAMGGGPKKEASPPRPAVPEPKAVAAERFAPPAGPISERLGAFCNWVAAQTGARQVFVIDEDGLTLADRHGDPSFAAIASAFMDLLERLNPFMAETPMEALTVELSENRSLHIQPLRLKFGRYAFGAVVDTPIERSLLRGIGTALKQVLDAASQDEARSSRPAPAASVGETQERSGG